MVKDLPVPPRSFAAVPRNPRVDQLRAERRELAHWLRLIKAKRDLIAARVVPPLGECQPLNSVGDRVIDQDALSGILDLNAPLPSSDELRLLQQYATQTSHRIAQLDQEIQAW